MTPQLLASMAVVPTRRRPVTDLRVVGVPRTHPCRRGAERCTGRAPTARAWCSALCALIDARVAALPPVAGSPGMSLGAEAAVIFALPWMDARAVVAA